MTSDRQIDKEGRRISREDAKKLRRTTFERKRVGSFYKNKIEYILLEIVGGCYKNKN